MLDILKNLLFMFVKLFKIPLLVLFVVMVLFALFVVGNVVYLHHKGYRFKKGQRKEVKKPSFLRKIFVDAPRRYALDMYEKDPDFFDIRG